MICRSVLSNILRLLDFDWFNDCTDTIRWLRSLPPRAALLQVNPLFTGLDLGEPADLANLMERLNNNQHSWVKVNTAVGASCWQCTKCKAHTRSGSVPGPHARLIDTTGKYIEQVLSECKDEPAKVDGQ